MIQIEKPTDSPYLVLDILNKEKNVVKGVHVIKMEGKNNIRLGRGHDSDIRITDISVSRCHAIIKLEKGNYYLEDNNSKFGTLVHMKRAFPIVGDFNNVSIQVGRTVLSLSVKKNWKILPACFSANDNNNTSGDERDSDPGDDAGNRVEVPGDNPQIKNQNNEAQEPEPYDEVLNQLDNDNDEDDEEFSPEVNGEQGNAANQNPNPNAAQPNPNQIANPNNNNPAPNIGNQIAPANNENANNANANQNHQQ